MSLGTLFLSSQRRIREVNFFTRTKHLLSKLNFREVSLFRIKYEMVLMMSVLKSILPQRHTEENVTGFIIVILGIPCRNI